MRGVVPFLGNHTVAGQGCVSVPTKRTVVSHGDTPMQTETENSKCRLFSQDEKHPEMSSCCRWLWPVKPDGWKTEIKWPT